MFSSGAHCFHDSCRTIVFQKLLYIEAPVILFPGAHWFSFVSTVSRKNDQYSMCISMPVFKLQGYVYRSCPQVIRQSTTPSLRRRPISTNPTSSPSHSYFHYLSILAPHHLQKQQRYLHQISSKPHKHGPHSDAQPPPKSPTHPNSAGYLYIAWIISVVTSKMLASNNYHLRTRIHQLFGLLLKILGILELASIVHGGSLSICKEVWGKQVCNLVVAHAAISIFQG